MDYIHTLHRRIRTYCMGNQNDRDAFERVCLRYLFTLSIYAVFMHIYQTTDDHSKAHGHLMDGWIDGFGRVTLGVIKITITKHRMYTNCAFNIDLHHLTIKTNAGNCTIWITQTLPSMCVDCGGIHDQMR